MTSKILIVDDHEDNRYTLKRRLKRDGYLDTHEAEDGYKALEMLDADEFDLVLLDLMMPGIDGFEVLTKLKAQDRFRYLPVIMISAADDTEKVAHGIELGAEDYLAKPFNPVILKARVQSALDKRAKSLAQLENITFVDTLTRLPNEAALLRNLSSRSPTETPITFVEIQLSKYSVISDAYGKTVADEYVLSQLDVIKKGLNDQSELFRYTSSSFIWLIHKAEDPEAVIVNVKKMFHNVNRSIELGALSIAEELKMGVVMAADLQANPIDVILQQLNAATSMASKKMPISYYADSIKSSLLDKIQLEADLREAIVKKELVLFYQPQVDAKSGKVCAAEALVRWIHPVKGMIPPNDFIPLAEENGMIIELGEAVITTAVTHLKECLESVEGEWLIPISVNVSAQHIVMPELIDFVSRNLDEFQVPSHLLKLELTESALVEDSEATIKVLKSMQELGLKISLDDFGTGFSSLSYLLELPLNQLKIDKKFVDNLVFDPRSQYVLKHVIGLAHDLSLDVVVEGVEDQEQADIVSQAGVDFIQGYFYFKPMPFDAFYNVVKAQR